MAGRFTDWTHVHVKGDRAAAERLISLGRKLLGYLANQRRLGAPDTLTHQKTLSDGSVVRARFIDNIPRIEITTPKSQRTEQVDIAGFVTWPTDADGNTALPESARLILAGARFRGVRHDRYSRLFPDVLSDPDDPGSPLIDGLARAGNVDWQGGNWVLSWYGPRTRYIDFAAPLRPWVFFKGKVLADMRDYIDTDAVVLGAAVATFDAGTWLVVVTEDFDFGQFERVSALRLVGSGLAQTATVDPDSYVLLDTRDSGSDITDTRHPWFFNPRGQEARQITRASGGVVLERIIALVADPGSDCGFAVERDSSVVPLVAVTDSSGYTAGQKAWHYAKQNITINRSSTVDLRSTSPGVYAPSPPPADVVVTMSFDTIDTVDACYSTSSAPCLSDWVYTADSTVGGDPWQIIAVDYNPSGDVVYGYARNFTGTSTASGGFTLDSGNDDIVCPYSDNDFEVTYQALGDGVNWAINVASNGGFAVPAAAAAWHHVTQSENNNILSGLRVGSVEVLAAQTESFSARADWTMAIDAFSGTQIIPGGLIGYTNSISPVTASGNPTGAEAPHLYSPQDAGTPSGTVVDSRTCVATSSTTTLDETLYLLHMDLRHGALVTTREQVTVETGRDYDFTDTTYVGDPRATVGTQAITDNKRHAYVTEGWMFGEKVLEETAVTIDTLGDAAVGTAFPGLTDANWGAPNEIEGSTGAVASVSDTDWPLTGAPFIPYPRDALLAYPEYGVYTAPVPPGEEYQARFTSHPILVSTVLGWAVETAPDPGEIIGYTTGDNRAKVKWHIDADEVPLPGAWCCYKQLWAFSMPLPIKDDGAEPFAFKSLCKVDEIKPRVLTADEIDVVDHFSPIWVLGVTRGFRPN